MHVKLLLCISFFCCGLLPLKLFSQVCTDDYFFSELNTSTVQQPSNMLTNSQNEVIFGGNVKKYNSLLQEAWFSKYSAQGTLLWTRHYNTSLFNWVHISSITNAGNDEYLLAGFLADADTTGFMISFKSQYAFIMKVDHSGNPIWSKLIGKIIISSAFSEISSVVATPDNHFILAMSYATFKPYSMVMKIDANANIDWITSINAAAGAQSSGFGLPQLLQLKSGYIVLVTDVSIFSSAHPYPQRGYYMATLYPNTGQPVRDNFFTGTDTLSFGIKQFASPVKITELPNGDISFIASYGDQNLINFRHTNQVMNFVTDSTGYMKKAFHYTGSKPELFASSVEENRIKPGSRVILMDNGDAPMMMQVAQNGQIEWQQSYPSIGRSQETRAVLNTFFGNYFLSLTHDGGSKLLKFAKTDSLGQAACIQQPGSITMEDVTSKYFQQALTITFTQQYGVWSDFPKLGVYKYAMEVNPVCRKSCCTDVTVYAVPVLLCNQQDYTLPGGQRITNSGTYTFTFKSVSGCDSIVYYDINFNQTPVVKLGADTCFGTRDSLVLKVNAGYDNYIWNGINTGRPLYIAKEPGIYAVFANNFCGSKSDTVIIFNKCEYDILMPNAFTPNGDRINDVFRILPQSANRLIHFIIYNRWGQPVFETNDISKGWDGDIKGIPAPAGTYVYYIIMESLDRRNKVSKKGWVTLLR
ncbi:hypothetical protein BH10BAC2_BH10BAC2_44150 [soil metagenome]